MQTAPAQQKPIAPVDLAAERAELGVALEDAVLRVLRSGTYILGPEVEKLEKDFAGYCNVPHGIAVATGTDALILGLLAVGVKRGDSVVTSPFTFFASASCIAWIGATPKLADVDPDTALLDPKKAEAAIDGKTSCILPVHLYGQLADMRAIRALADKRGLKILEDGAQCHGAKRDGVSCGELGDAGTYSFYPTKNLGACGEGGLIVTKNADIATRAKRLRDHGSPQKYVHAELGTNSRLQAFQGAVLNVKFPHLERWNVRRRELAARYDRNFAGSKTVLPLKLAANSVHVYHQYTVRIRANRSRDEVLKLLGEQKIFCGVHYPTPVHLQPVAKNWGYGPGDFPISEALSREVLCLPVHPFLTDAEIDRVSESLLALAGA